MNELPAQYEWLRHEPGPKMLLEALREYGVVEQSGDADNPKILGWAEQTGLGRVYSHDSIPWCGLFMAVVALRAGKEAPRDPLWALNWAKFGAAADKPMLGDVLVFRRDGGGHVAMYVGEDATRYHHLGGNQSDAVCIRTHLKSQLYAARRPIWRVAQPANVRCVTVVVTGEISTKES